MVLTAAHCNIVVGNEVESKAGSKLTTDKVKKVLLENSFRNGNEGAGDYSTYSSVDFSLILLNRGGVNYKQIPSFFRVKCPVATQEIQ